MAVPIAEPPHLAADLKTLCLSTITAEWRPLAEQATRQRQAPADYLAQLAHLEVTGRRERRIQRRMQDARFPMLKTLDAFSFDAQPDLDRDAVLQVFDCGFVAEAANVVLVGGVGTGKTHLAIALGMACCQHDDRVRFVTAAELVTLLVEAQQQGRLQRKLAQLARFDVVILDELGYVPFDKAGADLLFGFISQRYERRSLVVTTNLPFARWSEVFLNATAAAAVIDRIVHHATVLTTAATATGSKSLHATTRPARHRRCHGTPSRRGLPSLRSVRPRRDDHRLKNGGPFSGGQKVPFHLAIPETRPRRDRRPGRLNSGQRRRDLTVRQRPEVNRNGGHGRQGAVNRLTRGVVVDMAVCHRPGERRLDARPHLAGGIRLRRPQRGQHPQDVFAADGRDGEIGQDGERMPFHLLLPILGRGWRAPAGRGRGERRRGGLTERRHVRAPLLCQGIGPVLDRDTVRQCPRARLRRRHDRPRPQADIAPPPANGDPLNPRL